MTVPVLTRPTLILNRSWQPSRVATVARALMLVYRGAGRVIDPEDYQQYDWSDWADLEPREDELFIQGVTMRVRVPEVVVLTRQSKYHRLHVPFNRRNVFKRDRYRCQYCGARPGTGDLTIDHVLPRSLGGVSSWKNCVLACLKCNQRKANRTPAQAHMAIMHEPRRPSWSAVHITSPAPIDSWAKFVSEAYWNVVLDR